MGSRGDGSGNVGRGGTYPYGVGGSGGSYNNNAPFSPAVPQPAGPPTPPIPYHPHGQFPQPGGAVLPQNVPPVAPFSGTCYECGQRGHKIADCSQCPPDPYEGTNNDPCYKCGQLGHSVLRCPNRGGRPGGKVFVGCYICGAEKHKAFQCPNRPDQDEDSD